MTSLPLGKCADPSTVKSLRGQFTDSINDIATLTNLIQAHHSATIGKKTRATAFRYANDLGLNLLLLQESLINGTYRPKPCAHFEIYCRAGQKVRQISAPAYEDTIVQHLLYEELYETFDRGFIFDSYGCRRGKGTHKAADRLQTFMRQLPESAYFLQIDIRKYYYSINHAILRESINRKIADIGVVDLLMSFCDGNNGVGLNVGCLLSQLYGMIYLDRLDHYIKRVLKVKRYIRYVDDMVFVVQSKEEAEAILARVQEFLAKYLNLTLSKWKIGPLSQGINFAGMRTWASHRFIRKRSLHNFGKQLRNKDVAALNSILGHAIHTSSYRHLISRLPEHLDPEDICQLGARFQLDLAQYMAEQFE